MDKSNNILIYFNDALIASSPSFISYERETPDQKEYILTNSVSGLSATIFSNDLEFFKNENIQVEIK